MYGLVAGSEAQIGAQVFGLNCGGPALDGWVDNQGHTVDLAEGSETTVVDNYTVSGSPNTYTASDLSEPIASVLWEADVTFGFPVPTAGATYLVRLYFAETYYEAVGFRVFDVSVEGTLFLENFDIFAEYGADTLSFEEIQVADDGDAQINVTLTVSADQATITAVAIYEVL
jgi:hypothetical protein